MIKHIVLFKLAEKNPENIKKAVRSLKSLDGNIETLKYLEIGVDYKGSDRSYDLSLTAHFDNREGLETYATHKNHLPVVDVMRSLCQSSIVVDYEC
jgi:hypothetical protein